MLSLSSLCAFWLKHMNTHRIYCLYCAHHSLAPVRFCIDLHVSAELETTVAMLIQIDKLVQLIESPVFTCGFMMGSVPPSS